VTTVEQWLQEAIDLHRIGWQNSAALAVLANVENGLREIAVRRLFVDPESLQNFRRSFVRGHYVVTRRAVLSDGFSG
jgi:hypothetical protein